MDENQQRQVDEAAEKFAQVIANSYRAVAERGVSAQQLNAELTQSFFNGVIDNLRAQAEGSKISLGSWRISSRDRGRRRRKWRRRL
jgi:hypothetical protein